MWQEYIQIVTVEIILSLPVHTVTNSEVLTNVWNELFFTLIGYILEASV